MISHSQVKPIPPSFWDKIADLLIIKQARNNSLHNHKPSCTSKPNDCSAKFRAQQHCITLALTQPQVHRSQKLVPYVLRLIKMSSSTLPNSVANHLDPPCSLY